MPVAREVDTLHCKDAVEAPGLTDCACCSMGSFHSPRQIVFYTHPVGNKHDRRLCKPCSSEGLVKCEGGLRGSLSVSQRFIRAAFLISSVILCKQFCE